MKGNRTTATEGPQPSAESAAGEAQIVRCSRGETTFDNRPVQDEFADFDAFADFILDEDAPRAEKKGKDYICAPMAESEHNEPEKFPGIATWRLKKNAQGRMFLPFDIDGFPESPDDFQKLLDFLRGYKKGFAYTTGSHTADAPRLRIVLAQSRETTYAEGIALAEAVQKELDNAIGEGKLQFDPSVYRGEQPLYLPTADAETFRFDGAPVDVDAMLANAQPVEDKRKSPLDDLKTSDSMLKMMNALGMVRADAGGGKFSIECPFAGEHSMDGGSKETVYYLANTNGYAQSHFHCLHSHCSKRTDTEYQIAIQSRYATRENSSVLDGRQGQPPEAAKREDDAQPEDEQDDAQPEDDGELDWLMANQPPVLKAYTGDWYMQNAIRPHRMFAIASGLTFIQAVIGRAVTLPTGLRCNLWMLLLAPTESGKGGVPRLAQEALDQLKAAGIFPAVKTFDRSAASAEGIWWRLQVKHCIIFADEEGAKTLKSILAARAGTRGYDMRRTLLEVHDAAMKPELQPIMYSGRQRSGVNEMQPLKHPFFVFFGTGVPRDIDGFTAGANEDGLLNRFLVVVVDDMPAIGLPCKPGPLPEIVVAWAKSRRGANVQEHLDLVVQPPKELPVYAGFDADWQRETKFGMERAQARPGIWGRYAEKVLQVAMLLAVAGDDRRVKPSDFAWAVRFVRYAIEGFTRHFDAEGGGAENEFDAQCKAFLSVFDQKSNRGKKQIPASRFASYSRKWEAMDHQQRQRVVTTLEADGKIEAVKEPAGIAYRRIRL